MSQPTTLARPYARAAFASAHDAGRTAHWSESLAFAARVAAEPQVQALLGHPQLGTEQAVGLLAPDGADSAVGEFLRLLGENRRLPLLPEIAGLFEQQRAEAERIVHARVTSATPLAQAELASIGDALRRRFGRDVRIETAVDESLIGGAVIDAGDVVIDGSLRGKLARLQAALTH